MVFSGQLGRIVRSLLSCLILLTGMIVSHPPVPAWGMNGADVALYTDLHTQDSGVWANGLTAIKSMLKWMNLTYEEIDYIDLISPDQDFAALYKVIFFPGGMAYHYNNLICSDGKERIRRFVENGGGYFGICAGSFFAVDQALWDDVEGGGNPVLYDDDTGYSDVCGGPSGYSLDLFPGTGTGPINDIASFYSLSEGWAMTPIDFKPNTVLPFFKGSTGLKTMPFSEEIMYYGGPYFTLDENNAAAASISDYQILATYRNNGEAAIVSFQYGNGKVVLSGPHPEIEEDATRDHQNLTDYPFSPRKSQLKDRGSDWELVSHLFDWLMGTQQPITFVMTPPGLATPYPGGLLSPITQVITNHSDSPSAVSLRSDLKRPNTGWIRLADTRVDLAPGETRTLVKSLPIRPQAALGGYVYRVAVFDENGSFLDQDYLEFSVKVTP